MQVLCCIRRVCLLSLIVSACIYASANADQNDPRTITTELGHKVKLIVLSKGRMTIAGTESNQTVGKDTQGNEIYKSDNSSWIIEHTDQIRHKVGNGYGFLFAVPAMAKNDRIILNIAVEFQPTGDGRAWSLKAKWVFDETYANTNSPVRWHIRDGNPESETVGNYTFSVLSRGRVLDSGKFEVLPSSK